MGPRPRLIGCQGALRTYLGVFTPKLGDWITQSRCEYQVGTGSISASFSTGRVDSDTSWNEGLVHSLHTRCITAHLPETLLKRREIKRRRKTELHPRSEFWQPALQASADTVRETKDGQFSHPSPTEGASLSFNASLHSSTNSICVCTVKVTR